MGISTGIEWADSTCNPVVGCDGCELDGCYARKLIGRYAGLPGWPASFDRPKAFLGRIAKALKWPDLTGKDRPDKPWLDGKPRHIFWCDLSDPWTESMPLDWLAPYLSMLADSPHIHIFCTKRPDRAGLFFMDHPAPRKLILLTTVTSQATIWRAKALLRIPGISVRGVSAEPLLSDVDFGDCLGHHLGCDGDGYPCATCLSSGRLDWLTTGFESGIGARPGHPDSARSARNQCQAAGVPFFFKQWGEWAPESQMSPAALLLELGTRIGAKSNSEADATSHRIGKRAAGRLLDGREWSQMPEVRR